MGPRVLKKFPIELELGLALVFVGLKVVLLFYGRESEEPDLLF